MNQQAMLRDLINDHFDNNDIRSLCFDLGIDFDNIPGETKNQKIESLILKSQRASNLHRLLQRCQELRPKVSWSVMNVTTTSSVQSRTPYHNLPRPNYARFVGREKELAWLRKSLSPNDRAWQIAITGIGGVGKSTLAITIAHEYLTHYDQLPTEERFDAIIWISAKEEVLTAYDLEQADLHEKILHTLEDAYVTIAQTLEREDITRALPEEQSALVEKALRRQRTLLIMDNLESVQDERIKPFLRRLPSPTKALITSREWLDVADILPLTGLAREEADQLILDESKLRELKIKKVQRQRIFELTSGLPLPIKLGLARLGSGESFKAVEMWLGNAIGDLPEYCIQGQIHLAQKRNPASWKILFTCSLFNRDAGASKEALRDICGLSIIDTDNALANLKRLYLINQNESDRFWVFPIVQRFSGRFYKDKSININIIEKWSDWLTVFAEKYETDVYVDDKHFRKFENEYPNLRAAILWNYKQNRWQHTIAMCNRVWKFLYLLGLFQELEQIIQIWLNSSRFAGNEQEKGLAQLQSARLWTIWEKFDVANSLLDESENILKKYRDYNNLAEAWATRSQIFGNINLIDKSRSYSEKILELGQKTKNENILLTGYFRLIDIETELSNFKQAFKWLHQSESIVKKQDSLIEMTAFLYRKGRLLQFTGEYREAEKVYLQAIEFNSKIGARRYIAYNQYRLAQVYKATDQVHAARQLAEETLDLFDRLGMHNYIKSIEIFLKQLA